MADLDVKKPASGQTSSFTPAPDDRIVFDFETGDATLARVEDNLELSFEDGAKIVLTDFYEAYGQANMPTFLISGTEVDGEAFFGADEDLMPAAGDGGAGPTSGGTIVSFLNGTLLTGIDRLGGLDQVRASDVETDFVTDGFGDDGAPVGLFGINFSLSDLDLSVSEAGVQQQGDNPNAAYAGTSQDLGNISVSNPASTNVSYDIANNGVGGFGNLTVDGNGNLTYILNNNDVDTEDLALGQNGEDTFTITVSNGVNPPITVTVTVTIVGTNDRPYITDVTSSDGVISDITDADGNDIGFSFGVTELDGTADATFKGDVDGDDVDSDDNAATLDFFVTTSSEAAKYGADTLDTADDKNIDGLGKSVDGTYGTLTIDDDGNFEYTMTSDALGEGEKATESFTVFVKDQHGAWQAQEIVVNLTGTNDGPTELEITLNDGAGSVIESGVGRDADGDIIDASNPGNENAGYDSALTVSGTLSAKDADVNDNLTFSVVSSSVVYADGTTTPAGVDGEDFGSFTITNFDGATNKNTGEFTFTLNEGSEDAPNEFVNSLNEG